MLKTKTISKKDIVIPKRNSESHKGQNGTILVVGGSEEYAGAAALAGISALRSGADLVNVAAPEKTAWAINCLYPDLITTKIKGRFFSEKSFPKIKELMPKFDVLLIGNGIGLKNETKKFCKKTIKYGKKKLKVIDADALKSISSDDCENSIITPHIKELEQFMKNSGIKQSMIKKIINEKNIYKKATLLKKYFGDFLEKNNVLLLKGKIDCVITKDNIYFNKTGNAGMTKGGTGDVLAGLCAGFLSQSRNLSQSAINSAYFSGLIGDILLKKKRGFAYLASDIAEEIEKICGKKV